MHFIQAGLNLFNFFFLNRPENSPPLPLSPRYFRKRVVTRRAFRNSVWYDWGRGGETGIRKRIKIRYACVTSISSAKQLTAEPGIRCAIAVAPHRGWKVPRVGHLTGGSPGPQPAFQSASCTGVSSTRSRDE